MARSYPTRPLRSPREAARDPADDRWGRRCRFRRDPALRMGRPPDQDGVRRRPPPCRGFVAEADGAIVGTGVATINGPVAWIGTIWVDPAWRGRGLGTALTLATIEAAEGAGSRTLVLVATEAGQPLYERLGFGVQTRYRILEAPGLASGAPDPGIRPFRPSDLPAMIALDGAATGEDRAHLLTALAAADTTRCLEHADGTLHAGSSSAPVGRRRATIAPDPRRRPRHPPRAPAGVRSRPARPGRIARVERPGSIDCSPPAGPSPGRPRA